MGNIELVYEELEDPALKERLQSAKVCGELLLNLVNNLLDVKKVSSGTVEVSMEEVDARTFFNRIWLSCEEIIKKKGLKAELIDIE
jgi:signal transduction histidine kinase